MWPTVVKHKMNNTRPFNRTRQLVPMATRLPADDLRLRRLLGCPVPIVMAGEKAEG